MGFSWFNLTLRLILKVIGGLFALWVYIIFLNTSQDSILATVAFIVTLAFLEGTLSVVINMTMKR